MLKPFSCEFVLSKAGGFVVVYGVSGQLLNARVRAGRLLIETSVNLPAGSASSLEFVVKLSAEQYQWCLTQKTLLIVDGDSETGMENPQEIPLEVDHGG